MSGWPDIVGAYKGKAIAFEVKRPEPYGTPLTKLQAETLEKWKSAGAIAGVVRSVEDAKELLKAE
jgi:penicillin-binding protein-related factor A (putative recombinase)